MITLVNAVAISLSLQAAPMPAPHPIEVRAVVECRAGRRGTIAGCRVVTITHPGRELEQAALNAVRRGRLSAQPGIKEGDAFRVPVRFRIEG